MYLHPPKSPTRNLGGILDIPLLQLPSSQSTSIWLPSPKCLKLALCTPLTSITFASILFQAVFVSWTNVVTYLGSLPPITPKSRSICVSPVLRTPQWLVHHFQEEAQTHYCSIVLNSHGFVTAYLYSCISLHFPIPCAPAILNRLYFLEWTAFLHAYRCLHMLFPLSQECLLSPFTSVFL